MTPASLDGLCDLGMVSLEAGGDVLGAGALLSNIISVIILIDDLLPIAPMLRKRLGFRLHLLGTGLRLMLMGDGACGGRWRRSCKLELRLAASTRSRSVGF